MAGVGLHEEVLTALKCHKMLPPVTAWKAVPVSSHLCEMAFHRIPNQGAPLSATLCSEHFDVLVSHLDELLCSTCGHKCPNLSHTAPDKYTVLGNPGTALLWEPRVFQASVSCEILPPGGREGGQGRRKNRFSLQLFLKS